MKTKLNHAHAMKAYGGVEVQRPSFLTSVLDGVSGQLQALVVLPPGKEPPVPSEYEVGWAPDLVLKLWRIEKSLTYAGNVRKMY